MKCLARPLVAVTALLALVLVCLPRPGMAASLPGVAAVSAALAPAASPKVSAAEAAHLAATLKDAGARARLIADLEALAAVAPPPPAETGLLAGLSDAVGTAGNAVMDGLSTLAAAPRLIRKAAAGLADPATRVAWGRLLLHLAAVLAAGWAAERLTMALLAGFRRRALPKPGARLAARLPLALLHLLADLLPVGAFAAAGLGVVTGFRLAGSNHPILLLLVAAWAGFSLTMVAARLLVAPGRPALRLLPMDDETAEYLEIWVRRFAATGFFGWLAAGAARLGGLPEPARHLVAALVGLAFAALAEVFILQNRAQGAAVIQRLPGTGAGRLHAAAERLSHVWHGLAAVYVAVVYVAWVLPAGGGVRYVLGATALSGLVLAAAVGVASLADRMIDRAFRVRPDTRDRLPGLEARANRYLPALRVSVNTLLAAVTPLALLQAWGVESFAWVTSDIGRRILSAGISIAATLAVAALVWELGSAAIERALADGAGATHSARLRTLLPLARSALIVVLAVMVVMVVLSSLGVNIAPLLAGAGVVGIAVGFGSQKLVQDVITGAFILFEDTVAVGDVVKLDAHAGVVESLNIRAIRLRDLQGNLHTVPFSAVGTVVNMTRDFGCALFDLGVGYSEDVDHVIQVLRDLGEEMRADPAWAERIIDPLEVMGLDRFDSSAVIVRVRFKTRPMQQWDVQREFNRRIKRRFDELGIEIPFPQTKVWMAEPAPGRPALQQST